MKQNPLVSIIIPTYNIPLEYFEKSLNSLFNQTYKNVEIIVVDDNKQIDKTSEYMDILVLEKKIEVIRDGNNGVSTARNKGIEKSKGDWIMFVDPDDWAEPNLIEALLKIADTESDIVACSTYVNYVKKEVKNHFFLNDSSEPQAIDTEVAQLQLIAKGITDYFPNEIGFGVPWAKLYRSTLIKNNDLKFNPKLVRMQDNVFNLYALELCRKLVYINEPLFHYRKDEESASNAYQPKVVEYYEAVNNATEDFINEYNKGQLFNDALSIKVVMGIHSYLNQLYLSKKSNLSYFEENKAIKNLLSNDYYQNHIRKVKKEYLLSKEKVFFQTIKLKSPTLIRSVFLGEHTLRKIKNGKMTVMESSK